MYVFVLFTKKDCKACKKAIGPFMRLLKKFKDQEDLMFATMDETEFEKTKGLKMVAEYP